MDRISVTLPRATIKKLDRFVRLYKRSQAVNYAILAMLSPDHVDRDQYRAMFISLVSDE